jgi:hypothetical protein
MPHAGKPPLGFLFSRRGAEAQRSRAVSPVEFMPRGCSLSFLPAFPLRLSASARANPRRAGTPPDQPFAPTPTPDDFPRSFVFSRRDAEARRKRTRRNSNRKQTGLWGRVRATCQREALGFSHPSEVFRRHARKWPERRAAARPPERRINQSRPRRGRRSGRMGARGREGSGTPFGVRCDKSRFPEVAS